MIEAGSQNKIKTGRSPRGPKQSLDEGNRLSVALLEIQAAGNTLHRLAIVRIKLQGGAKLILGFAQLLLVEQGLTQSAMKLRLSRRRRERLAVILLRIRVVFEQGVHVA